MHQRRIDGFVVVADALAQDRRAVVVVVDDVTVATGGGAEAGMEMLVHLPDPAHGDVRGQVGVEPQGPGAFCAVRLGIEVDHLAGGMHPRIGATGTLDGDGVVGDAAEGFFQLLLDADHFALALPAEVPAAVIFNTKGNSHG